MLLLRRLEREVGIELERVDEVLAALDAAVGDAVAESEVLVRGDLVGDGVRGGRVVPDLLCPQQPLDRAVEVAGVVQADSGRERPSAWGDHGGGRWRRWRGRRRRRLRLG